jgi:fumarate hydratase subunit alpha
LFRARSKKNKKTQRKENKLVSEKLFQEEIAKLVFRAESEISEDAVKLLNKALEKETSPTAQSMLQSMVDNLKIAKEKQAAVCQSPGYPAIYIYFGDNNLPKGVKDMFTQPILDGTANGYLRPSIVHPLTRKNTGNNSGVNVPNFTFDYRAGQPYVDIYISLKGCGAELGNAMKIMTVPMLGPGPKFNGLKRFVLETAMNAAANLALLRDRHRPRRPDGPVRAFEPRIDQHAQMGRHEPGSHACGP